VSVRANPAAIGLFMIGALVITVWGVFVLASPAWFGDRQTFVSYFDETVNGLERGAPVKFRGVPVGAVTELLVQINAADRSFRVPVQYEVDLTRLTTELGTFLRLDQPEVLEEQIGHGLRAQLQMESLVTGQLYVELTFRPEAGAPPAASGIIPYPEIPTTPSLLAAFGTDAGSLVADVVQILFRVNEMLEEVDMRGINRAVVASAESVERLLGSEELLAAVGTVPEMTAQFGRALAEMEGLAERLAAAVDPLQTQIEGALDEWTRTLHAARGALERTEGLFTTDSGLGYGLDQTLASLRDAAEALRILTITLERNPDMLIRGPRPPGR